MIKMLSSNFEHHEALYMFGDLNCFIVAFWSKITTS